MLDLLVIVDLLDRPKRSAWRLLLAAMTVVPLGYVACTGHLKLDASGEPFDASAPDVARDQFYSSLGAGGTGASAAGNPFNELCGVQSGDAATACDPDDVSACQDAPGGADSGASGEGGGAGGQSAAKGLDAGMGGASAGGGGMDAGFKLPEFDAGPTTPHYACQVTRVAGHPMAQCVSAGLGGGDAPCVGPADCQPGFACVTDGNVGHCVRYCCAGNDSCEQGAYCATRPLKEDVAGDEDPLLVPVCVPADNCDLADPYPCTAGTDCTCPEGTACSVVRSDGTTSCTTPGTGVEGDDCSQNDCAWGFICSHATNKCVKLCMINANTNDCGSRRCQSAADLPSNWGVCVGDVGDGG